jgi:hypothetical protein
MPARSVDAVVLRGIGGDIAVGRSGAGDNGVRLRRSCPPYFLGPVRVFELHVVAINAVDDPIDSIAHLIPGQALGQNPANDLLA